MNPDLPRTTRTISLPAAGGASGAARPATVAIVGAGPAGLMAAEVLAGAGVSVHVYDAMPSVGRKFLLAGRGGLNLTHSEPRAAFIARYSCGQAQVGRWLEAFGPAEVRGWCEGLGIGTFIGSSGRVFPTDMKAAPLLRAWLHRLRLAGVRFHTRHRWIGWGEGAPRSLRFAHRDGEVEARADAWVLALGGASWPRLGSDGAWVALLEAQGVEISPLRPSNCGFDVGGPLRGGDESTDSGDEWQRPAAGWSEHFRVRHAGDPVKTVALRIERDDGASFAQRGEFIITEGGVEGNLIYAASHVIVDAIAAAGRSVVRIDLLPHRSVDFVRDELARPRGSRSLSTHLKSRLGLDGVKAALLHERLPRAVFAEPASLAAAIKSLPLQLVAPRPIAEAISTAGGVSEDAVDERLMLRAVPDVFCAGEMLDWDAPTGGYLLTACLASGVSAARGVLVRLAHRVPTPS
jgi:predicted flavoprotein YhiN